MKQQKLSLLATALILTCFLIATSDRAFAASARSSYAPNQVLIKLKITPSQAALNDVMARHNLTLIRAIPRIGVNVMRPPAGLQVEALLRRLALDPRIEFAEPNYVRYPTLIPNDPLYSSQWDMTHIGMETYWDVELGDPSVVTAILDTGINLTHPDLMNQIWVNSGENFGNSIDDDGNGYVDDYYGYDFAGDGIFPLPNAEDPIPEDPFVGHGTHVGGTVAAEQNNSVGIAGEAPGTKLMAVRVLGGILGAGYSSDIVEGILYATDNGADIINMSLGGGPPSVSEYLALQYAWNNNVFIAVAAGNEAEFGNAISYPASYVFSMSIGATDISDNIASFSNHNSMVEISAPGVNIFSTVPVSFGSYEGGWDGTSMVCPHVAGLAALLYSQHPGITNWQVRSMLRSAVVDPGTPGWDEYFGHGRVDAALLASTPLPSTSALEILLPADGGVFEAGAILSFLWNPVNGAATYRLTFIVPGGGMPSIVVVNPYYTVPPFLNPPTGAYSVQIEALDGTGTPISTDTVSFGIQ